MAQVSLNQVSGGGVIQNFSLEVRDRELAVLAGPRECGHSALLRLIAGLEPLASGEIAVGARPVQALPPAQRDVAFVFPEPALFPRWTVARNIAFGLRGRHFPKAEIGKRVREAAEVAGAAALLERVAETLSPVEGLRVALARAIVRQPKAILMDDPLSALGPEERETMRAELVKLQERLQATVLFATSDPRDAFVLGHRVAVIESGVLRQFDAPLEIYRAPVHLFAAAFLGRPKINLLSGKLRSAAQGLLFKEEGGTVEVALEDAPKEWLGRDVILGIRPEELEPGEAKTGKSRAVRCQGIVDHVEATGAEVFYSVETGGHTILIRERGGEPVGAGRRIAFDIDPARVHLFDAATNERLAR